MDTSTVVVINSNSTERITEQIRSPVADLADGVGLRVITSSGGPPAIESDSDVKAAIEPRLEAARSNPAEAYVIACFSDPGLDRFRESSSAPVFGIAESAVLEAVKYGKVGVVSSVSDSGPRPARYWDRLGLSDRIVRDVAVESGVLDLEGDYAYLAVLGAANELRDAGADVIVRGCTGMSHMRRRLSADLGLRVIDPCRSATAAAIGAVADRASG